MDNKELIDAISQLKETIETLISSVNSLHGTIEVIEKHGISHDELVGVKGSLIDLKNSNTKLIEAIQQSNFG